MALFYHFNKKLNNIALWQVTKTLHPCIHPPAAAWLRGLGVDTITTYLLLSALPWRGLRPQGPVHRRLAARSESRSRGALRQRDTASPATPPEIDQYPKCANFKHRRMFQLNWRLTLDVLDVEVFKLPLNLPEKVEEIVAQRKGQLGVLRTTGKCRNMAITYYWYYNTWLHTCSNRSILW